MNSDILKYVIIGVAAIAVVWIVSRRRSAPPGGQTRTINRLIPLAGENNTSPVNRDQARVEGFQALANIAGLQISSESQERQGGRELEGLRASLISGQEIERIKAGIQRELGLFDLDKVRSALAAEERAYQLSSADRRYDIDAQLLSADRALASNERLFGLREESAWRQLQAQIAAVGQVGQQFRGQSLERQGTILNALASIWGQRPYDYQSAFGGPRPPGFFQGLFGTLSSVFGGRGGAMIGIPRTPGIGG